MPTPKYQRATSFVPGIGGNLEAIQERDVLIRSVSIDDTRSMNGEPRTLVLIDVSEVDGEEVSLYHAWSESLATKLAQIPADSFPVIAKFRRISTANGFRVWTFE